MRSRECEADYHVPKCACLRCEKPSCGNCRKTNVDHFTGKAIGNLLGISQKYLKREENLQYLSYECHAVKDKQTNDVMDQLKRQRNGEFIGYGEHVQIGILNNTGVIYKPSDK